MQELYNRTKATLDGIGQAFEFIVIDDGSTDDTLNILLKLREEHPNIAIITHYKNNGKSVSLMHGFDIAKGSVAITMDADLQDVPEAIPDFLEKLADGFDLVNGWRRERNDIPTKRFVSSIYNMLVNYLFRLNIHDVNCGFKAMRRQVFERLELRGDMHRLIPIIAGMVWGFKITEISIPHESRKFGKSRYRLLRHRGLLDIITLMASNATRYRSFHVFCEISFFILLLMILSGAVLGVSIICMEPTKTAHLISVLSGAFVVLSCFLVVILPLYGLHLEILLSELQKYQWRNAMIKGISDSNCKSPDFCGKGKIKQ